MTVLTTTANETFTIPCQNVGVFDATVEWGDGSKSVITSFNDADLAHNYVVAASRQIKITPNPGGAFPNIYFNNAGDRLKVTSVENLGVMGWLTLSGAFFGCTNMTSFVAGNTDTSALTGMFSTFSGCTNLASIDLAGLTTPNLTNMNSTFFGCTSLVTVDVSSFVTSNVISMFRLFRDCTSLIDIIGVEAFDIEGLNATVSLTDFALGVTLPTARYDAILIAWDAQNPFDGMSPHFGSSTYTGGGVAAAARANLISTDGWTITDGGIA
jgi:surface protein